MVVTPFRPRAITCAVVIAAATARAQQSTPEIVLPLKHTPHATTPAISAADLMTRLYIFADDSMLGRAPSTLGERRATAYLERELRRLGLRPAGENGGYVQAVPLVHRVVSARSALSVDGVHLVLWTDFAARERPDFAPGPAYQPFAATLVVFGGPYGDTTRWISAEAAAGKAVLLTRRAGDPLVLSERFASAAAVIFDDFETWLQSGVAPWRQPRAFLSPESGRHLDRAALRIHVTQAVAQRLFGGARPETLRPGAQGRTLSGLVAFDDSPAPARNVVALLPGLDPHRRGEYVALTAHHDHLGYNHGPVDSDSLHAFRTELERRVPGAADGAPVLPELLATIRVNVDSLRHLRPARSDSIYNGAEDDGSGSVALLEIAEALAAPKARPARSVLFVWHAAEELGLLGASWYTDHPTVPRDSIVAAINVDGFGRWTASHYRGGRGPRTEVIGARRLSTELGDLVERVNDATRHPLLLDYTSDAPGHPDQMYCRSDHYMYARYGIPSVFVTDPGYPDYHMVSEEPQYIDYSGFAYATQFVHDLVLRVANAVRRPAVDRPRPADPNAACVQ